MKFPFEDIVQKYPDANNVFTPEERFKARLTEHTARKLHQMVVEQNRPIGEWQIWQERFIKRVLRLQGQIS
jgi:hypothetical protein